MEKIIRQANPSQVFHIPFARSIENEVSLWDDWFIKNVDLSWIEYLNAKKEKDILKVDSPFVVITGGGNTINLLNKINEDRRIFDIIMKCKYLIWESAGSMILGEYLRVRPENEMKLIKWLWILKDTIVEPHYSERSSQNLLEEEMDEIWAKYGIWIDCVTAMEFDLCRFPDEYKKLWNGTIEIKIKSDLIF